MVKIKKKSSTIFFGHDSKNQKENFVLDFMFSIFGWFLVLQIWGVLNRLVLT
jgi:hypothetical protein